jgi:hypothetical protein
VWIRGLPLRVRHTRGIAKLRVRCVGLDADEFESVHGLRLAVLEDLEIVLGEPFDDLAVLARVGVHAHQHGAGTEHRQLLRRRGLLGRLIAARRESPRGDEAHDSSGATDDEANHWRLILPRVATG